MNLFRPLDRPFAFMGAFALTTILLLPIWLFLSNAYLASMITLVNAGTGWAGLPLRFQIPSLVDAGAVHPGIVAGAALFITTPNRSCSWKLRWIASLFLLFWMLHTLLLFLQVQIAFSHFLDQLLPAQRLGWQERIALPLPPATPCQSVVDLCESWACPLLYPLFWFVAVRRPEGKSPPIAARRRRQTAQKKGKHCASTHLA